MTVPEVKGWRIHCILVRVDDNHFKTKMFKQYVGMQVLWIGFFEQSNAMNNIKECLQAKEKSSRTYFLV